MCPYLQYRPQGNCLRGRWTTSLSTFAGMRNSLITMLGACYYTTTMYSCIILHLFLDRTELGLGRGWGHEEHGHRSEIQARLASSTLFTFFNMETKHLCLVQILTKPHWPSHQPGHFIAILEYIGKDPDAGLWRECPLELKRSVMAWAANSSNTGTNKK